MPLAAVAPFKVPAVQTAGVILIGLWLLCGLQSSNPCCPLDWSFVAVVLCQ